VLTVLTSDGVYLGLGSELVARRLLLRASSRLKALGLALIRVRSALTGGRWTLSAWFPVSVLLLGRFNGLSAG
jgi:hypothetical protein